MSGKRIAVECVGGPLDGHQSVVDEPVLCGGEVLPIELFQVVREGGGKAVWAYAYTPRLTRAGRMVLEFFVFVGVKGGGK